jgi:hypothetical protein
LLNIFDYLPDGFNSWFGGTRNDSLDCMGRCIEKNGCEPPLLPGPGFSLPVAPIIPKELLKKTGFRVFTPPGSSRWTTLPSVINHLRGGGSRVLRRLSKWSPYLVILDGTLATGKIAKCAIYCSHGMIF